MPAKNKYHDLVRDALIAEGWTITDDPLSIAVPSRNLFIDLGAERHDGRDEKVAVYIAVEIQTFADKSKVADLEQAIGQYYLYSKALAFREPERKLYLAVPALAYKTIFAEAFTKSILADLDANLIVYDPDHPERLTWTK